MNQDAGDASAVAASATEAAGTTQQNSPPGNSVGTLVSEGSEECRIHADTVLAAADLALPDGWRDRVRAELATQLERGGTLYTCRGDGAYVARTESGDRVIARPISHKS